MANMFSLSLPVGAGCDPLSATGQPTQLDKMLADERVRSEQHKNIYQKLKTEHQRLQDQYMESERQLKAMTEEKTSAHEKYKSMLEQSRTDLHAKQLECERLREQVMTKVKMDMLRVQLSEELDEVYRAKYQHLSQEGETTRSQYNQLKYEYTFLKSEFEHEREEHHRIISEMKMLHEKEVTSLRREREMLITKQQAGGSSDAQRMRVLARENAQVHLKMKGLLSELEEVRAQNEHQGLQSDHVTRLQLKQLSETTANLKACETERESLKLQVESLQRELSSSADEQTRLMTRVHELEKDAVQLKSRADEVTHRSNVELATLKIDMLKERGELERERDRQRNQVEELTCQVETVKLTCENYTEKLDEKERELVKSVQAVRAEEWQKQHALENENLELESKLQEVSRRRIDEEQQLHKERERMEGRMKELADAKEAAEKEALVARTKVQHQQSLTDQLEREHAENSELRVRLHRIETQYTNYVNSEQELNELNERLTIQVERLAMDLERAEKEVAASKSTAAEMLMENKTCWAEERLQLQTRISELDDALMKATTRLTNFISTEKHKKKKIAMVLKKLKSRNKMLQVKLEQLETENQMLKRSVVPNADKLKKQLRDLWRRHQEFSSIILSGYKCSSMVPGAEIDFTSITVPYKSPSIPNGSVVVDSLSVQQKDLEQLKERLDQLDDNQRHQLNELRGFQDCVLSETVPLDNSQDKENAVTPQ